MSIFLITALIFAALEAFALHKDWPRLEYVAKPAVMLALLGWLVTAAGLAGALLWFGLGLVFSLAGDVLLMISLDRLFMPGLVAFLVAHILYIIGFNIPPAAFSAWSVGIALVIGVGGVLVIRQILRPLAAQGQTRLRIPLIVYSVAISLMLFLALLKLTDRAWAVNAAALVSVGAFLFYLSDIILAWNKFVAPLRHGRIYNIAAYHLGQIALMAGVILQFQ